MCFMRVLPKPVQMYIRMTEDGLADAYSEVTDDVQQSTLPFNRFQKNGAEITISAPFFPDFLMNDLRNSAYREHLNFAKWN